MIQKIVGSLMKFIGLVNVTKKVVILPVICLLKLEKKLMKNELKIGSLVKTTHEALGIVIKIRNNRSLFAYRVHWFEINRAAWHSAKELLIIS